jgi:hypothetical protein
LYVGEGIHSKRRRGPEVNNLETFPPRVHEHQVLGLQVAVDYFAVLDVDHALDQLEGEWSQLRLEIKALKAAFLKLGIKILAKELEDKTL